MPLRCRQSARIYSPQPFGSLDSSPRPFPRFSSMTGAAARPPHRTKSAVLLLLLLLGIFASAFAGKNCGKTEEFFSLSSRASVLQFEFQISSRDESERTGSGCLEVKKKHAKFGLKKRKGEKSFPAESSTNH